jgi:hypothetical protein
VQTVAPAEETLTVTTANADYDLEATTAVAREQYYNELAQAEAGRANARAAGRLASALKTTVENVVGVSDGTYNPTRPETPSSPDLYAYNIDTILAYGDPCGGDEISFTDGNGCYGWDLSGGWWNDLRFFSMAPLARDTFSLAINRPGDYLEDDLARNEEDIDDLLLPSGAEYSGDDRNFDDTSADPSNRTYGDTGYGTSNYGNTDYELSIFLGDLDYSVSTSTAPYGTDGKSSAFGVVGSGGDGGGTNAYYRDFVEGAKSPSGTANEVVESSEEFGAGEGNAFRAFESGTSEAVTNFTSLNAAISELDENSGASDGDTVIETYDPTTGVHEFIVTPQVGGEPIFNDQSDVPRPQDKSAAKTIFQIPSDRKSGYERLPGESDADWIARIQSFDSGYASVLQEALIHQEEERTGVLHHWGKWDAIAERNANKRISKVLLHTADGVNFVLHLPSTVLAGAVGTDREGLKDAISVMSHHSHPGAYHDRLETYYGAEAHGFNPKDDPHRMFSEAGLTGVDFLGVGGAIKLAGHGVRSLAISQRIRIIEHVGLDGQIYRFAGQAGPGIASDHLVAAQALANETGVPIVIHGSRQSGVSHHTGLGFRVTSDLDLGIVGSGDDLMNVVGGHYDWIPDVAHPPMKIFIRPSEAFDAGHLIVFPVQ